MQVLYIRIDSKVKQKLLECLNITLNNIESAIENSKIQAEQLIKQIQSSLSAAIDSLNHQKEFYQSVIVKCSHPYGITQGDYQMIWRILNDFGSKDIFKIVNFSGQGLINPTLSLVSSTISELGSKSDNNLLALYQAKAKQDYAFKEILEVISKVSIKKLEIAGQNCVKIIQDLRRPRPLLKLQSNKSMKFKLEQENYQGLAVLFEEPYICLKNPAISPVLANFLSQDLMTKIFQTGKNLSSIKNLLPQDLHNFSMSSSIFETIKGIENICIFTNQELIQILLQKYEFHSHCNLIKKFFLFGQGDFYHKIFEELFLYKRSYDLSTLFEECIWKSNACSIPEAFLSNLSFAADEDFYNLEWDSYQLHYKLSYPLTLFFSQESLANLQEIFSFVWQVRRVDFILKQNSYKRRLISRMYSGEIEGTIHQMNLLQYRLIAYMNAILFYLMEEIIECSWCRFKQRLASALNLEDIDFAIREMINFVKQHCFLSDKSLNQQFYKLLRILIKFIDLQHEIESSLVQDEDTNDNDYQDSIELFTEITQEFTQELHNLKLVLAFSQNKAFYFLRLKLNEIR